MAYDVIHKNSTVAGTPPTASEIELGEIAINAADAELYTKDSAGNIRKFQNTTTGTADGVQFTQAGTGAVQRTVESKLQDVVSVLDFIPLGTDTANTNCTGWIQAAIDATPDGGTLIFPPGTYALTETATTGNVVISNETGTSADAPDYVILQLIERHNIKISGYGATLTFDRGYVLFLLLCETVFIEGLSFVCNNDPHSTGFTIPSNWEPAAVQVHYSMDCHVDNCTVKQVHRGLDFRRTAECSATNNKISKNNYIGIASYGDFFQPASWTGDALITKFTSPGHSTDSGILIENNLVSDYKYFGLYSNGPAVFSNNRVDHPIESGATPGPGVGGTGGILSSSGKTTIIGNRFFAPLLSDLRDGSRNYTAISLKLEDVADGSTADNVIVSNNWIDGCAGGISATETANAVITNNVITNYTANAINLIGSSGVGSNIFNTIVTDNVIGEVDASTTVAPSTYNMVGGIVTSVSSTGYYINKLVVTDNVFNRNYDDITDGTALTNHQYAIYIVSTDATGELVIQNNKLVEASDGLVYAPNDSIWEATFNGVQRITGNHTITEGHQDQTIVCDVSADATISTPAKTVPGTKITIINRSTYTVTFDPPVGSSVSGYGSLRLASYCSVTLVLLTMGINGTTQYWDIAGSDTTRGGTLTLI